MKAEDRLKRLTMFLLLVVFAGSVQAQVTGPGTVTFTIESAQAAVGDTAAISVWMHFDGGEGTEVYLTSVFANVAYDTANVEFLWSDDSPFGSWFERDIPFDVGINCETPKDENPLVWLVMFEAGPSQPPCDNEWVAGDVELGKLYFKVKRNKPITLFVPCYGSRVTGPGTFEFPGVEILYAEKWGDEHSPIPCYQYHRWWYDNYNTMDSVVDGTITVTSKASLQHTWGKVKGLYRGGGRR